MLPSVFLYFLLRRGTDASLFVTAVPAGFNASDDDVDSRRLRLWEALDVSDSAEGSGDGGDRDVDSFGNAFGRVPGGLRSLAGDTVGRSS